MMASGVLLRETEGIDAVWLMSGRIVPAFASGGVTSHPKPVLSQHGVYDEVLPVEEGRALADLLRERGHIVSAHEYPMGHQISGESLADAREWLQGIQRR
jgi:phospholipase/carboxylesterase